MTAAPRDARGQLDMPRIGGHVALGVARVAPARPCTLPPSTIARAPRICDRPLARCGAVFRSRAIPLLRTSARAFASEAKEEAEAKKEEEKGLENARGREARVRVCLSRECRVNDRRSVASGAERTAAIERIRERAAVQRANRPVGDSRAGNFRGRSPGRDRKLAARRTRRGNTEGKMSAAGGAIGARRG